MQVYRRLNTHPRWIHLHRLTSSWRPSLSLAKETLLRVFSVQNRKSRLNHDVLRLKVECSTRGKAVEFGGEWRGVWTPNKQILRCRLIGFITALAGFWRSVWNLHSMKIPGWRCEVDSCRWCGWGDGHFAEGLWWGLGFVHQKGWLSTPYLDLV